MKEKQPDPWEIIESTVSRLNRNGLVRQGLAPLSNLPEEIKSSRGVLRFVCGVRYMLDDEALARHLGEQFQECRKQAPQAIFSLVVLGYHDPRKLEAVPVPEVRAYIRRFASYAGLGGAHIKGSSTPDGSVLLVKLREGPAIRMTVESVALLDQCGADIQGIV